jgi:riboflavin synthase
MFTGLVEGCGLVRALRPDGATMDLGIEAPAGLREGTGPRDLPQIGDSVATNGCCLTLVRMEGPVWWFQAGAETLARTNLGRLQLGDPVNLERSLPVDGRIGGHFVQGHVDGVATVESISRSGEWIDMAFACPPALTRQMVSKGSIAIDGVSLTLVTVEPGLFSVMLIPHTLEVTTLGVRKVGDQVNIETDILGKYVEKLMGLGNVVPAPS